MRKLVKSISQDPIVHFVIISSILYLIYFISTPKKETILVSQETITALVNNRTYLLNRTLSESEIQQVIGEFIDEEILIRQAQIKEIPEKNTRIRKMIIDQMRIILAEEPPEPTKAELEELLRNNQERFIPSLKYSFNHVYYRFNSPKYINNQATLLNDLKNNQDFRILGDNFMLGNTLEGYSETELKTIFGTDFVQQIKILPHQEWSKAIRSNQGIHYVKITKKEKPLPIDWLTIEPYLKEVWKQEQRKIIQQKKIDKLRKQYLIKIAEN